MTKKRRILTGITTSGIPHLGNLSGAVLPAIKASENKDTSSFLFLADYHSLIKNLDPILTHESSFEVAACWLACGLNPDKVTFYRQSDIPHVFELTWVLSCLSAKGLFNRAHAYKASVSNNELAGSKDLDKGITMGLFNYPVLMAADILMFNANIVPVGQDQKQHIEMTRDIAARFNHHYGDTFTIPEALIDDEKGVLPGLDGQKMSKSYKNVIPVFTDKDSLRKAVMKIKTNSKAPGEPKEIDDSTIFKIYKSFASIEEVNKLALEYKEGIAWGNAKEILFNKLEDSLANYKSEYTRIVNDRSFVEETLIEGSRKALEISFPLIQKVRKAVGIKGFAKLK